MQPKTLLWGALVSVALLAGLSWLFMSGSSAAPAAPGASSALAAAEPDLDLGQTSMAAGEVAREYSIRNSGAEPVIVTRLYTSCMCTEASLLIDGKEVGPFGMIGHGFLPTISETIAPGAEAIVRVVFDPAAHGPSGVGPVARTITVETKDGAALILGFRAMVTP